jgi:hypothetical protein
VSMIINQFLKLNTDSSMKFHLIASKKRVKEEVLKVKVCI